MLKVIVTGCFGYMGRNVCELLNAEKDCVIAAGVDIADRSADFPVYKSFAEINGKADVIIDFSHPSCLEGMLDYAVKTKTPVVIATTGLNEAQKNAIKEASDKVAIFFTANMSLGVNLLSALVKKAASVLGGKFDIEIVEKHHNKKIDAPSGTALMLADAVSEAVDFNAEYVYDRHSVRKQRDANEIGISSIRGGTIVGEHDVIFAGEDEVITLSHSAYSKRVFAAGAVNAAKFIASKDFGLYSMEDMLSDIISL
ncbi:MAG: 4-hydroxy-tetrahydrodipicolinate reductase [Clostridia bacterium]|nr:4-hydroxy-tetrahydrodipicolinate reductase [Clostridia bacterium]MBR2327907.1 4-hydroxy-tetrahydrodipicolinate reductase [Clostridia bacterium]